MRDSTLTSRRRRSAGLRRAVAAFAALALVVAACGSDDEPEAAPEPADEPDAPEAAEPEEEDEDVEAYYDGLSIELIVPTGAGGGTDTQARFMAPFLTEYIPGNPAVAVENIPGGGHVIGTNEFYLQREHDGTSLLLSSATGTFTYFLQDPAVEFDYRDFTPVLGVPTGAVVSVRPDIGVETPEDLPNATEQLVQGEQTAASLGALFLVAWELLELDVSMTFGYGGAGETRVAFEQGETNLDYQTTSGFLSNVVPLVEAGDAIPLFSVGQVEDGEVVRDPNFPDLPHVGEVYEMIHGEPPSGQVWDVYRTLLSAGFTLQKVLWTHGDAPDEAVDALRAAAVQMLDDPDFQGQAEEVIGEYDIVAGDAIIGGVDNMLAVDDDDIDWLIGFLVDNYDLPDPR